MVILLYVADNSRGTYSNLRILQAEVDDHTDEQ